MPDLNTQRVETGAIDEQTCRTSLTQQWLLECKEDLARHPITAYNLIDVLICGEEGFVRIAADLQAASESIEMACWGFDPGMEVTRGGRNTWPRGHTLGSLLEQKANQGVKVRLLAWYDAIGSGVQKNLIGHSEVLPQTRSERLGMAGAMAGGPMVAGYQPRHAQAGAGTPRDDRHDYCVLWWRRALAGDIPNMEVRLRAGNTEKVKASLERAEIAPGDRPSGASGSAQGLAHERRLIEKFATHHQKTILIDYEREEGRKAVGYVMGLNSVTDYWDSPAHHFNDPRREVDWACKSELAKALGSSQKVSRDPYQDYAARLRGEALQDVDRNFSSAWQRAQPGRKPLAALHRKAPQQLPVRGPGRRIQVVRTQPEEGDHTIQRAYWQATRSARRCR